MWMTKPAIWLRSGDGGWKSVQATKSCHQCSVCFHFFVTRQTDTLRGSVKDDENLVLESRASFLEFVDNRRHLAAKSKERRAAEPE